MIDDIRSIVRQWDGKKISEAGIYADVSMEAYHGDLCVGPSTSRSNIWAADDLSPRHARRDWYGNDRRKPQVTEKAHFTFGRAVHFLAASEAHFSKHFVVRPPVWDSWRTKDSQAWRDEQTRLGMGVLTPDDIDAIRGVADSLHEHPTIQAGILHGLVEHTIVWQDQATGLWMKSRPDVISVDSRMIVDLKSTADARRHKVQKSSADYGYHLQLAMADEGLKIITKSPADAPWASEHVLVYIEKKDPWCVNIKPFEAYEIDYGRRIMARGAEKFARALSTGIWHGYDDDEVPGGLPSWYLKKLKWESDNGLLPKLSDITSKTGFTLPDRDEAPLDITDEDDEPEEAI